MGRQQLKNTCCFVLSNIQLFPCDIPTLVRCNSAFSFDFPSSISAFVTHQFSLRDFQDIAYRTQLSPHPPPNPSHSPAPSPSCRVGACKRPLLLAFCGHFPPAGSAVGDR